MLYSFYKIKINNTDFVYAGSTTNANRRKLQHKKNSCITNETCSVYNYKVYQIIRQNGGWENCVMVVIETLECNDKKDVKIREQYWIEFEKANLNSNVAYTTLTKQERDKLYYCNNVEKMQEYRIENKDRIDTYNHEYHIKNQVAVLEKAKIYREQNQDKIKENNKKQMELPPILCECGKYYTYKHKSRHLKSKTHQESIELK